VVAPVKEPDLHAGDPDGTDLAPEEKVGLIPTWIVTRADLNRAEARNIATGLLWARRGRFDLLDRDGLATLHRRMFGDVWRWAGQFRRSEKNIGVPDWWRIPEHLQLLTGDITAQIEEQGLPPDEIAVGFHHRLVAIHPFPNGNGRHSRLAADLLVERLGRPPFSWGGRGLGAPGEARAAYIAALRAADAGDLAPLISFARK
jgi:Fic-DOC domain mobile mystery protein B